MYTGLDQNGKVNLETAQPLKATVLAKFLLETIFDHQKLYGKKEFPMICHKVAHFSKGEKNVHSKFKPLYIILGN